MAEKLFFKDFRPVIVFLRLCELPNVGLFNGLSSASIPTIFIVFLGGDRLVIFLAIYFELKG